MIGKYVTPTACVLVTTALTQYAINRFGGNNTPLKEMALISVAFSASQIASHVIAKFAGEFSEVKDTKNLIRFFVYLGSTIGLTYLAMRSFNLSTKMSIALGCVSVLTFGKTLQEKKGYA